MWCFEIIEARRCQPITASDSFSCLARAKRAAEDKKRDFTSISERSVYLCRLSSWEAPVLRVMLPHRQRELHSNRDRFTGDTM